MRHTWVVRTDPRTQFPHTDGICTYILEYANGLRCVAIDDTWTGPSREGCASENYIKWRIEGTNGLAIGDIGWCKIPFTTPSDIRYASKGHAHFECPIWKESWFPDAFIGTMAQLLIALETETDPAISGRDNLKTMALVQAAEVSAVQSRLIGTCETTHITTSQRQTAERLKSSHQIQKRGEGSLNEVQTMPNFTPRAQQALALARKEADQLYHNFVGTEHLLLGMIGLGRGVAVTVLQRLGLDLESIRAEVHKLAGAGPAQKIVGNIPYTPRVKQVLALAAKEARNIGHTCIGTEHILLGILVEGDGVSAKVLRSFNVNIEQTRKEVLRELDLNFKE